MIILSNKIKELAN